MNDWLVANLNNPDFSISDFKDIADMSIDNTLFLKKDLYLKSDYILNNPMFKGNDGLFNRLKFDLYYDTLLKKFQEFTTDNSIPNGLELDVFDTLRTPNSRVKKDNLFIGRGKNPDRLKIGIEGVNVWSTPEMSRSEIAQTLKVFNTATGKYEDYTPNDKALFNGKTDFGLSWIKSLFSDPLVMALYDEDTTDQDGTKHYKGEYKLNDEGTYYYETLNSRSPIGKLVLSALDILTVDGSNLNKYDFFDSDDIEKSVTGVVAKNVASLIPIFIGGPVGTIYSTALIAREMAKSLPMLYGMTTALFSDSETPKWMNTIAAMGDKFTSGTSDYAKEHAFSVENFGNMIADVALQWGLLKGIANAFNKLKGSNKYMDDALAKSEALYKVKAPTMPELAATVASDWKNSILGQACLKKYLPAAEKAMKESSLLGRDASLAYMAIVSNSDVYNDMLQAGASKKEAAAVALGSTLGMFAVDKYAGLGELFFDDATENSVKAARRAIKNELLGYTDSKGIKHKGVQEIIDTIKAGQDTDANKIVQLLHGTANKVKNLMSNFSDDLKYHTTGFFGKAFGEGLEEVGEEVVTDTAKSIYELAGYLGADTSVKDVGAWDNMLERYTMSFLGGALGGGIFYGVDVMQNGKYKANKTDEELVTLIRNGHINELRDEVEKLRKKGKLGSTKLSASKWETTTDGNNVWLTTDSEADSLNLKIADIINLKITALDSVINNNLVGLSDDALFKNMVLGEQRYYMYLDVAPITDYYEDFNEVLSNLIKAELDYKIASLTLDGSTEITEANKITDEKLRHLTEDLKKARQDALTKLQLKVDEARLAKDAFLSGDSSIDYMRKLNFALDPILHAPFMAIDEKLLWEKDHNKSIEEATPEELMTFLTLTLPEAKKFKTKELVTKSWERFKQVELTISPELHKFTDNAVAYKQWFDEFLKIVPELTSTKLKESYLDWDSKLDTESDNDYENRNTKFKDEILGTEESDADFDARRKARVTLIKAFNDLLDTDWANTIDLKLAAIGYNLDPITRNTLINTVIPYRIKDLLNTVISRELLNTEYSKIVAGLKNDLSNLDEIRDLATNFYNTLLVNNVKHYISEITPTLAPIGGFINPITGVPDSNYGLDNVLIYDDMAPLTIDEILNDTGTVVGSTIDTAGNSVDITIKDIMNANPEVTNALNNLKVMFGGNTTVDSIINSFGGIALSDLDSTYVNNGLNIITNSINNIASNVLNNAIFKLANKLKTSIKNPVIEVAKALVGKVIDKEQLPDVFKILDELQDKFETIDDISDLLLDAELLKNLNIAKSALLLVSTYLYAASSTPKADNIIGHNKIFNEYAAKHSDRITKWDILPEIDEDYATIYQTLLANLGNYIDYWILLSNNNDINKRKLFIETDKAFTKSYNEFWSNNKDKFKITVKGKDYNLLDGVKDDNTLEINLFNYEKTVYNNFQLALKDSGLSVTEFLEQSKLLDKLINYDYIDALKISKLNPLLKYDDLSEYDKLVYISTILSLDPIDFYNYLKSNILGNSDKAPITTLEYASRVLIAKTTDVNKDILNYAYSKSDAYSHNNGNTVICIGDAGSGKTSVVVNNAIKFLPKDTNILCVGPTDTLANSLQESIGKGNKMNVETLFRQLLGDDVYNEIMSDLNINFNVTTNKLVKDSKYFDAISNYGSTAARIKDGSVTFKPLSDNPKVIVIDEATHVPSVLLLYLDAYMKLVGGTLILLGDIKQNGFSKPNGIGNMDIGDLFATRTPELNVSLRDNNILKLANLASVKSIVSSILTNIIEMPNADYTAWTQLAIGLLDKIKFRVYNNDTLSGDLITATLDNSIISKIKGAASIGFIGDASSAAYLALKKAGVDVTLLSLEEMQGQEFDYVVIDLKFTKPDPKNPETFRIFMLNLYTLMSRGKTASIFIDNGLSNIIGKNIVDDYTAKAPSLTDKINGKSAVDLLKERKLQIIELFDLTKPTPSSPTNATTPPTSGTTGTSTTTSSTPTSTVSLTPEDFTNPDEKHFDEESKKTIDSTVEEEKTKPEVTHKHKFTVMSFGDVDYLGVKTTEQTYKDKNGIKHKINKWDFAPDVEGNLRNLSALRLGKDEDKTKNGISKLTDKLALLEELYKLKSILIFGHSWIDPMTNNVAAPAFILDNFNQSDWENGEFEVEFRSVDGEVMPIFGRMPEIGMTYKGDKFIANIVYKVKNKEGKTCIFDLCGLNNPETLIDTLLEHKDNLTKWKAAANKDGNDARVEELSDILATSDEQVKKYANTFESAYNKFEESPNKHFSVKLSNPAIIRQSHVWFKSRGKSKKKNIRLGGLFDLDNIKKQGNNYIDLMHEASNGVFSDVYTYAAKSKNDLNIDMSLKGRAVIFWSSDKTLKPEELVYKYIELKQDPEHNKPVVRMITLDNYGMSFNLMLDLDFIKKVQGGDTTRLPYRANYVGLSMYVSMWNWRAALKQFRLALNTWMSDNKYDDSKLNNIILAVNEIYYSKDKDAKIAEWNSKGVTKLDLDNLHKFNKDICNDVMFFRLGQSDKNGFHIQDFEVNSSNYIYPRTKTKSRLKNASFLVVTPEKAAQFELFIDRVFEAINPNNYGIDTPGLLLVNAKTGQPWSVDEYIDIEEANAKNSLSGLITPDLNIESNGITVVYKQGELWSAIPKILNSMVRTLDYYLYNPEEMNNTLWSGNAKVTMKDKSGADRQFSIAVNDFIDSGLLHSINNTSEPEGLHPDRSLRDMFDLMFHGTTENIHKPGVHKLNNVRFPNGFYINPDIARVKKSGSSSDIESIEYDGNIAFYPIKTNPALFTADIELRAAGLDIDADEFAKDFENTINPPKTASTTSSTTDVERASTATSPTSSTVTTPELTENQMTIELFNDLARKRKCLDEEDLEVTIDTMNQYSKNAIIPTVLAGESLTQIFTYVNNNGIIELKSIFKQLQELTGEEEPTIEYKDDKVFVNSSELDIINMEIKSPVKPADTILDRDYEGKPIGQAANEFINSETFKELVNNDDWCDESELDNFIQAYNLIYLKRNSYPDEESLKTAINGLKDDFSDFTSLIESNNSELYNKLFEC